MKLLTTSLFCLLVMFCCCGAGFLCPKTHAPQYVYYTNPVVYGYPYYTGYNYTYYQYSYPTVTSQSYVVPYYPSRIEYRPVINQYYMNYGHYYSYPTYVNYNNSYYNPYYVWSYYNY